MTLVYIGSGGEETRIDVATGKQSRIEKEKLSGDWIPTNPRKTWWADGKDLLDVPVLHNRNWLTDADLDAMESSGTYLAGMYPGDAAVDAGLSESTGEGFEHDEEPAGRLYVRCLLMTVPHGYYNLH